MYQFYIKSYYPSANTGIASPKTARNDSHVS
jgi:hypothetical protein